MAQEFVRRWFNVREYNRMAEAGILTENDRVELIEGEIIEMSPIGSRHAACVKRLNTLLNQQVGQDAVVSVQDPIYLDDFSEPQPDIALLRPREDFYAEEHPAPPDILLVIEVADTSVEYDRNRKLPLYARADIPEVWLVNLPEDIVEVYLQPANGQYQRLQRVNRGESLVSESFPSLTLNVDSILG